MSAVTTPEKFKSQIRLLVFNCGCIAQRDDMQKTLVYTKLCRKHNNSCMSIGETV